MSLEYSWSNLKDGYYLIRGVVKSERAICDGRVVLEFSDGKEIHKLPIHRSGRINHILRVKKIAKGLKVFVPRTPNLTLEKELELRKLNFAERLYHFYRRILGTLLSKNPATIPLKMHLDTNLLKALLAPEETYYRITDAMYRRICSSKDYKEWLLEYEEQKSMFFYQKKDFSGPSLLLFLFLEDKESLDVSISSIKSQLCPPDRVVVCSKKHVGRFLEGSSEDYVIFLEKGDILDRFALCCFREFAKQKNLPHIIYADHHYIGENNTHINPYFKPDWSVDYFFEYDYIKAPVFFKRELLNINEFTSNYEIILQVLKSNPSVQIEHIPELLLTRLRDDGRYRQKLKMLKEYLGGRAEVYPQREPHTFRVVYACGELPKVSIVIPTKNKPQLIKGCVNSLLERTDYPDYQILIVDNGSSEEEVFDLYREWEKEERIKVLSMDVPFNFSKLTNFGVSKAEGDLICLLNNDTEVIEKDWLREMVSHALRKEVGVVGAKLLYPDGTVQHGGVIMGIWNGTDHAFKGIPDGDGYMFRLSTVQNYLAVTAACMVFRKEVFYEVGGFDERFEVDFNDVDFCLKVFEKGYRILWTPYAKLLHLESKTKKRDSERSKREINLLRKRWDNYILHDPYYNKNLTIHDTNFGLSIYPDFTACCKNPRRF